MKPFVSFIMPTFNRAYIIGDAIQSILAQTYQNWELILIDDGSVDNTKELIEKMNEPSIRYYYQTNKGAATARNKGLESAKGEWIAYLDSDNTLFPAYLEVMLDRISEKDNVIFAFPKGHRHIELYKDGKMIKRIDETKNEFGNNITPRDIVHRKLHSDLNGMIHSKKVIEDGIRFDEKMRKLEDWELFLTLCERYPEHFLYVNELLYSYHQRFGGDGLVSNSTYQEWADIFEYIYQKHKNDKLMKGQTWYPDRVNKWKRLAEQHKQGLIPDYSLYYFKENWDKKR